MYEEGDPARLTVVAEELKEDREFVLRTRNSAEAAISEAGISLPDTDSEKIATALAVFIKSQDYASLKSAFQRRVPVERRVARKIHRRVQQLHHRGETDFEIESARAELNDLVDQMYRCVPGASHTLFDLECEFHAVVAELGMCPTLAQMIREVKANSVLCELYRFQAEDVNQIVRDHKTLFDKIFDPKVPEKELDAEVERHVMRGAALKNLLAPGNESWKFDHSHRKEAIEMTKGALETELVDYYSQRFDSLVGSFDPVAFSEICDRLVEAREEDWIPLSSMQLDAIAERCIINSVGKEGKYILYRWVEFEDEDGDSRIKAEILAVHDTWQEVKAASSQFPGDMLETYIPEEHDSLVCHL